MALNVFMATDVFHDHRFLSVFYYYTRATWACSSAPLCLHFLTCEKLGYVPHLRKIVSLTKDEK